MSFSISRKIKVGGEEVMAKKSSTTFRKMKKPRKKNNQAEISQEQNFERALKKIEVQNNYIND